MKRVLFRKILITYLIIAPFLFILLELYLSNVVRGDHISGLRESLLIQGRLIADRIPPSFRDSLDDFCRKYKEKTGARITVIDDSGRVLGDSDEPSAGMENHADSPEIKEALISGSGSSIRFSRTLRQNLFYLAVAVNGDTGARFLRLSVPLSDVEHAMGKIRIRIVLASLVALLAALFLGLLQTRSVTRSVEEITAFSREIAAGNLERRLFLDEKGEIGELAKNINEMALELKKRLRQSEEEKKKVEAILRNLSDGLLLIDAKGHILLSNDAVKSFFHFEADIEGRALAEALRNAEIMEAVAAVLGSGEPFSCEVAVAHPKELYLMANATPYFGDVGREKISGVVLTLHDITRLKQLEEMRRDFVANVSHEIKTPLTAIKGFAETLLEGAINDRENAYRFIETIRNHSERLNSLVNDLLTLSGIELGEVKIEKTEVSLDGVVDEVFMTLNNKALGEGLYLRKQIPSDFPRIRADRDRLIQILLNLVDNGIKFTEYGGVTVGVEKTDGGTLLFVEDTGVGIAKRHLSRLGERFYRIDRARSRELGGTGLGLAIVKHLVMAHGWEMRIESTEGRGTKVKILLTGNDFFV